MPRQNENQEKQAAVNANAEVFAEKVMAQKNGLKEGDGKRASLAVAESKAAASEPQVAARKAEADAIKTMDYPAKLNAEKTKHAILKAMRAAFCDKNKGRFI